MKIKKLRCRLKIVKPFKVTKFEDSRLMKASGYEYLKDYCKYQIQSLDMTSNAENWKEAKEELKFDLYHLYHVCVECHKSKLGGKALKWRKILKKHIKARF